MPPRARSSVLLLTIVTGPVTAQVKNLEVLSTTTRPGTAGYSGIWGYVDPASGRELALVALREGTWVVETTNPRQPVERGYFPGPVTSFNREITTYRNYAYVITEAGGGMQVLDLANPGAPTLVNTVTLPGWNNTHTATVDHDAGTLWCCGTSIGMLVFDVATNPVNPPLLLTWTTRYVHDAYVRRGYAYLSLVANDQLWIADARNLPALPIVTMLPSPLRTHTAWTDSADQLMLVSGDYGGGPMELYDIANKSAPVLLSSYAVPGHSIHNHFLSEDKLSHVACILGPYRVVDVSDRRNPREVAALDGIQSWGSYPYQPSGTIYISDVPNTTGGLICVRLACGVPQPYGRGTAGSGGFMPVADWNGGVASVGNAAFRLEGRAMLGGSTAALALGAAPTSLQLFGVEWLVAPAAPFLLRLSPVSGAGAGNGTAAQGLAVPNDPTLASASLFAQWLVLDPAGPLGVAASSGRKITVCP